MLTAFVIWVMIMNLALSTVIFLKTENYQATETPNSKFQIMVYKPINQPQAIYLKDFQNQILVNPIKNIEWYGEDFLRKENDVLTYHNEGALWNTESKYKIVNQKIQPISFRLFTFFEVFEALILSLIFYTLSKIVFLRFCYLPLKIKLAQLKYALN